MIKEKELREARQGVRYPDAKDLNYQMLQAALEKKLAESGVSIAFEMDQVKYGGLGGAVEDCLVLYHPNHKTDYMKLCVRIKHQGNYAFVSIDEFGESKMLGIQAGHDAASDTFHGGSMSEKFGALLGSGFRRLFKGKYDKRALEEEKMWYTVVADVFDAVFS